MARAFLQLLLAAIAAFAQADAPPPPARDLAAERDQVTRLMQQSQSLAALPLLENLVAASPDDPTLQAWLAYCLFAKSRANVTADEAQALRKRARDAALRARQLGSKWVLLNDLLASLEAPATAQPLSSKREADARMKEGEQAFGKGDYDGALAAYSAALKIDPKLYEAALFAGDVCFRKKDLACASDWFGKAVAIDPGRETAYRYWGDALMAVGKAMEARDKFIEAVIAQPNQRPWAALSNWAKKNDSQLSTPKIERPNVGEDARKLVINPGALDDGTGRAAWIEYSITRAAWRQALFAQKYPNEKQYRHTLEEETAALNAVADAIDRQKAAHLDPQLVNIVLLKRDGLLEAWILISGGPDPGIGQDYATYRDGHHAELRAYFDKYIIRRVAPQFYWWAGFSRATGWGRSGLTYDCGRVAHALLRAAPTSGRRRAPRGRGELRSPALTGASARQAAVPAPRGDRFEWTPAPQKSPLKAEKRPVAPCNSELLPFV